MVADSARRKFDPVAYDVVLERQNVAWLLAFQGFEATLRHRERVVRELPLARLYAPLEHREIDYPAKGEQVGVGERARGEVDLVGEKFVRQLRGRDEVDRVGDHPPVDVPHRPCALGCGQECPRQRRLSTLVEQSHQELVAANRAIAQIHDRLAVGHEEPLVEAGPDALGPRHSLSALPR